MKKLLVIFLSVIIVYILYNSICSYRLVSILNSGNLKYKTGTRYVTFARAPFSIINPFKKQLVLDKIFDYCKSEKFNIYYYSNEYEKFKYKDYLYYKKQSVENKLIIRAIKNDKNNLLILVTDENHLEREIVFVLDKKKDEIIGYF